MSNLDAALSRAIAEADQFARAGDILADMLGYSIAAIERGEQFTPERLDAARQGIVTWHRMRALDRP